MEMPTYRLGTLADFWVGPLKDVLILFCALVQMPFRSVQSAAMGFGQRGVKMNEGGANQKLNYWKHTQDCCLCGGHQPEGITVSSIRINLVQNSQ